MIPAEIYADFESSGLNYEALVKQKLVKYVTPKDLAALFKDNLRYIKDASVQADPNTGAVAFQYYRLDGTTLKYSRYKIYWGKLKGFTAAAAKEPRAKYLQDSGTSNHLYIPPIPDWEAILADSLLSVVVTEGEKKALALCSRGMPCLGLGGVSSIGNRKRGQQVLPELEEFCKGGRTIYIVFDVDKGFTVLKPEVARAAMTLANIALEYGGNPRIVTLPSEASQKMALDDWLLTHDLAGPEIALELSQYSKGIDTAQALYEEAERYVYIEDSNTLGRIDTRTAVQVPWYRTSSGLKQVVVQSLVMRRVKNSPPIPAFEQTVQKLSEAFLTWPSRPTAKGTTYLPGEHHYLTERGEFNMWKGWAQQPPEDMDPDLVNPAWEMFQKFYGECAEQMWNWFLYPIAKPGAKHVIVPVIQSHMEGIGKSTIPTFFAQYIYGSDKDSPNNATILNAMSLRDGGRLEYMVNKQFLFLDDANDLHGNDVEALIKNIATTTSVRANPKYVASYDCKNYANLVISTNRTLPFKPSSQDRRLYLPDTAEDIDREEWKAFMEWGKKENGGGKLIAYAQQHYDVEAYDPYQPAPMTARKEHLVGIARHPFEAFILGMRQIFLEGGLRRTVFTGHELKLLAERDGAVKESFEVHNYLLSRSITEAGGCVLNGGKPIRINNGTTMCYALDSNEALRHIRPKEISDRIAEVALENIYAPKRATTKVLDINKKKKPVRKF